jgi:hypothetical protein
MAYPKNLFEIGTVTESLLKNPVFKNTQEGFEKLIQGSGLPKVSDCSVPFVDKAQIEKSLKLTSTAFTANTYVMTDTFNLMTSLAREGFESVAHQLQVLANCSDIDEVIDAQYAYAKSLQDTVLERSAMNTKVLAGILETNASIAKEAFVGK